MRGEMRMTSKQTRRNFLFTSIVAGAAVGYADIVRSTSVIRRKNITDLDAAELQILRDAVQALRSKDSPNAAAGDGWEALVSPHVEHCFTGDFREIQL